MTKALFSLLLLFSTKAFGQYPNDYLFQMVHYETEYFSSIEFISLSPLLPPDDDTAKRIIREDYLGYAGFDNYNYHELDAEQRSKLLKQVGFSEADCLYLYDLEQNANYKFELQELKVSAFLNFYSSENDQPFQEYYYHIGLEVPIERLNPDRSKYSFTLGRIAKHNPFAMDSIRNIQFEIEDCQNYDPLDSLKLSIDSTCTCYRHQNEDFNLVVIDHGKGFYPKQRDMLISETKSGELINHRRFRRSEGTHLSALNVAGRNYSGEQFSGKLLKEQGIILYGFIDLSFGCAPLFFVNDPANRLGILCDNRH